MEFAGGDIPEYFGSSTCVRRGLCPVTKLRPHGSEILESHSLYFEQHGKGTKYKIILIMGLNVSLYAWKAQVEWFGGGKAFQDDDKGEEKSTVLVFDNRGVGNSGYPRGPYTTSGMAEDVVTLLDYVGWTGEREVHVVGMSLGGMIAQELALRIPQRIGSLLLAVTSPGGRNVWNNLPPWKGLTSLTRLTFIPDPVRAAPIVMSLLFPDEWLDAPDEDIPEKTNRAVQTEFFLRRMAVTKHQALMGQFSQMAAALTHHVDEAKLRQISESVGQVTIVTGDDDHLVFPEMSRKMKAAMRSVELVEWKGTGHAIQGQWRRRFNSLTEQTVLAGVDK